MDIYRNWTKRFFNTNGLASIDQSFRKMMCNLHSVREHQHILFHINKNPKCWIVQVISWTCTFYNNVALKAIYLVHDILYVCQRFKTSDTTFETHMRMGTLHQCLTSGHACCLKVSTEGKRLCCYCLLGEPQKWRGGVEVGRRFNTQKLRQK